MYEIYQVHGKKKTDDLFSSNFDKVFDNWSKISSFVLKREKRSIVDR